MRADGELLRGLGFNVTGVVTVRWPLVVQLEYCIVRKHHLNIYRCKELAGACTALRPTAFGEKYSFVVES